MHEHITPAASFPADNSSGNLAHRMSEVPRGYGSSMLSCCQGQEASLEQASSSSDEGDEGDDYDDGEMDEDDQVAAAAAAAVHTRSGAAVGPPAAGPGS